MDENCFLNKSGYVYQLLVCWMLACAGMTGNWAYLSFPRRLESKRITRIIRDVTTRRFAVEIIHLSSRMANISEEIVI